MERGVTGFWVGMGGGIGAIARLVVGGVLPPATPGAFPFATFAINVTGSLLLGFLHRALPPVAVSPQARGFLTIGLCGGFTTFSLFDYEMLTLLQAGRIGTASSYAAGSVLACVAGVILGLWLAGGIARAGASSVPRR
jgi:fluoride exporter